MEQSRVYVVDDDDDLRQAMQWMLHNAGFEVESYPLASEFLSAYDPEAGGCLVLDVRLPHMGGLELLRWLRRQGSSLPIIMITAFSDVATAVAAVKEGALDYLVKPFHQEDLVARVRDALAMGERERAIRLQKALIVARLKHLTPRERQVMDLLIEGRISKQIAFELGCSVRTIESHRARVMRKMNVDTIAKLVRLALRAQEGGACDSVQGA